MWQPASVAKQEVESQPTHSCAIWTSACHVEVVAGDRKLSLMGCLCSEAQAADEDGVVLAVARRTKETRCPELVGFRARARLVVLGFEVGRRWSGETQRFVSLLARAKARCEVWLLRRRAEQAWRLRWGSLLSCTVARAVAQSLLELPGVSGADGETPPLHEVERTFASLL